MVKKRTPREPPAVKPKPVCSCPVEGLRYVGPNYKGDALYWCEKCRLHSVRSPR